jgi:predicted HAD superfamily phosphohydrolase
VPDPANPLSVPPVTVMSAAVKSVAASERVKVMVSVSPSASVPSPARVTVIVGAVVSNVNVIENVAVPAELVAVMV